MRTPRPSTLSRTLALVPPAVILVSQQANATFNSFLKFSTIAGESIDAKHANWIDITRFSFGSGQSTPTIPGGPTTPIAKEFTITKKLDKSSPQLFLACATGEVGRRIATGSQKLCARHSRMTRPAPACAKSANSAWCR